MSHVTSAGCCLTPDDTTNTQSTSPSLTIIINMPRDGAEKEGGRRKTGRECKQVNKQEQRRIDRESDS